ncbi:neuraminidase-like domain-containing protein [Stackebrandtia nassauensis]|uniref:Insecticidal toxin complex protein n=1 Tax=Stackebrandtia nassauensis (strain DSM 44728 / CIP 108903 / NRRL B-16338 / NBRC 102104 / LLR-40K-21) TaxID=446470 RepID=D3PZB4_STANL|nr:neuraminidase-like domain-containing protein [Stackebrandtia nassauensis]ADD41588.1 insecticidal toxin complex protein [Stackebrandtia nassauensis DSM 44728]
MAALIVIRIHPVAPTSGSAFTSSLTGLKIKVFDLRTKVLPGGTEIGTAEYVAPPDNSKPWLPAPTSRIVQHYSPPDVGPPPKPPQPLAVATAVIEVPSLASHPEHSTSDLRLEITRGTGTIIHKQLYFNVPVNAGPLPASLAFPNLEPTSLYLPIVSPGLEKNPDDAYVDLPANGQPPGFAELKSAVEKVLGNDPKDGSVALSDLTPQQARHIASEIVWNAKFRPRPPLGTNVLENLYTVTPGESSEQAQAEEQARKKFEGELASYYPTGEAEAERLAGYVFALSTAVRSEALSNAATKVGFRFPVVPGATETGERFRSARVFLTAPNPPGGPVAPAFSVPANYFYVLGASLSFQVTADQRYQLALLAVEERSRRQLREAVDNGVITEGAVKINQAVRRLRALGDTGGADPTHPVTAGSTVATLVTDWLAFTGEDINAFWDALPVSDNAGHLELVLRALTGDHKALIDVIRPTATSAAQLRNRPEAEWRALFGEPINVALLPPFTKPGSAAERLNAFIRHVQKFFVVATEVTDPADPDPGGPPSFHKLGADPLSLFVQAYNSGGAPFFEFGTAWDTARVAAAVHEVFGSDPEAAAWLQQLVETIEELTWLAKDVPDEVAFSVMEALYARGFTSRSQVGQLSEDEFTTALIGTIAYEHADAIYGQSLGNGDGNGNGDGREDEFVPVNDDGCLVNCLPPDHLSALGPVRYLHELLRLTRFSTCDDLGHGTDSLSLGALLAQRRGPLGDLLASAANLGVPLPLVDLVNECLENVAAGLPAAVGAVYQTGEHTETLLEAVPEHSTPATPVAEPSGYDKLRADFSAPPLPYHQGLDINRTYLKHLRTSRFDTMRRFRRDITELVLDPAKEPAQFQRHLWRYPVRFDIAMEYLGITAEEYENLYAEDLTATWELYGFTDEVIRDVSWTNTVVWLSEFLERTGLDYCEFLQLWRSEFVVFKRAGRRDRELTFDDCEPCELDDYRIEFVNPKDAADALRRLIVFIRLWRKLRELPGGGYDFATLRDICEVLRLFDSGGHINPDFIRQLAAFQMLRDDFSLALTDGSTAAPGATGAKRTHILSLWVGPSATHWPWAIDELLDQVQVHAQVRHGCGCREPEFLKLLAENLDPLSILAGFDPGQTADTWHARPTHTLRFAEILGKIYASDFGIGEVLFLFSSDDHVDGDDPFPLQPHNEAQDSPLGLPDDETPYSLWELRDKLLAVEVSDEDVDAWSWSNISTTLRGEFGFAPQGGTDPLITLGEHYFPSILEAEGYPVPVSHRQYRTGLPLAGTAPLMWNTPAGGPYRYDIGAQELWTQLPLTDEAVIAKLSRIRQLKGPERVAVNELYFRPRADLAPFAFVFDNFTQAEEALIQEADEQARWRYFQREFARCHARCVVIAEHLAAHVDKASTRESSEGYALAWTLLRKLFADENRAVTSWEDDSGEPPEVTWPDQPSAGAFAALLGLTGTGLLGEFTPQDQPLAWREVRGPMDVFGPEENAANVQIPTVLPGLDLSLTHSQQLYASSRNGFTLANADGELLGGAQGFTAQWSGLLLVDGEGDYEFHAGMPSPEGEAPEFDPDTDMRWRVQIRRGQRSWVVLSHHWPDESAPSACSTPLPLRRGTYQLVVEFQFPQPEYDGPEDVCPVPGGFQVKYRGPDTDDVIATVPHHRLFRDRKTKPLDENIRPLSNAAKDFLELHYTSTVRDIRRTYQRAFKALLFAHRFSLSAVPAADDGQSEIDYLLAHAQDFTGTSYYRQGGGFEVHRAWFDPNFLPLKDNYFSPTPAQDRRVKPTAKRQQALFDWWERLFDYTVVRRDAYTATERPLWFLFHEAAENHPDDPAHLLRHMGVDLLHTRLLLRYYEGYQVSSEDLEDERWAVRVWHAENWVRAVREHFLVKDIRDARPDLWAGNDPGALEAGETVTGNQNLTTFVHDGCFHNGQPIRFADVKRLNDGLRERARAALLAYLCGMDRVSLPWGGFARVPRDLSELLLIDVEAGLCEKASRIEEAVTAVQTLVQRARLGLEPALELPEGFKLLWDRRFATFRVWEACARREYYPENWIDWDALEQARRSEAFTFLEDELRRVTLTVPKPGGMEYWKGHRPPVHPGLIPLQSREPAQIEGIDPEHHGWDLLGTPERAARNSWLATVGLYRGRDDDGGEDPPPTDDPPPRPNDPPPPRREVANREHGNGNGNGVHSDNVPLWVKAAIRLGVQFVRVAAAAEPPASAEFKPNHPQDEPACCTECGEVHKPGVDEYYFWPINSGHYTEREQDAGWSWHEPDMLPKLLHWESESMVHLAWTRVHNGQFMQPRRSSEGVMLDGTPKLLFRGRTADSLTFEVEGGLAPVGHDATTAPGFRYDLVTDSAVTLPLVAPSSATPPTFPGELTSYPYFGYFSPGAPVTPDSPFAPALVVAASLRTHCQYEAALKWYELVFDPLHDDSSWCYSDDGGSDNEHEPIPRGKSGHWSSDSEKKSITLHYLETLLQWGDAVMRRHSPESFARARLIFDTAARLLGERPRTINATVPFEQPPKVSNFVAIGEPVNPRLMSLYDQVRDRLALIHACVNDRRHHNGSATSKARPNVDMPYFGDTELRDGWQSDTQTCLDDGDWCAPASPYRFTYLVQKANEVAAELKALGAGLLAAYEKGDAEYLASLRSTHERQLVNLALANRQNQWREADWQVQALRKTKEIAQTRRRYYATLLANGLNSGETEYVALTGVAIGAKVAANVSEAIAQGMAIVPDMWVGVAGIAGTPLNFVQVPLGTKLAGVFSTIARISHGVADIASTTGGLRLTQAGWDRREEEWRHQVEVLDIEIDQIERQILAAERRRDVALRELNIHQRQIEQSAEVQDFLRDKFSSHDLYLFLQAETAALHRQTYELALHVARQAQRAFNYESGHTARAFLLDEAWDDLRENLLSGERMQLSLRQMEHTYLDENLREYELTKHLSLRLHFPAEFLRLQATGTCDIDIPEWMFDVDYPGQYMRRVKNVTMTIPCVAGPYTGVHSRLTLLSSATRVSPVLSDAPPRCCDEESGECECGGHNGYPLRHDDPRVVRQYAATEAIATSTGRNDSGLFELNFRDERYLPFEFAGAVSRWRIELPQQNNQFDIETVSDVVLHLGYTAREGGDNLRRAAAEVAQAQLPCAGVRYFDVAHDMPQLWHRLDADQQLPLRLSRSMFPFLTGGKQVNVSRVDMFVETCGPETPSDHHLATFAPIVCGEEVDECDRTEVHCVASDDWPNMFHGVVEGVDLAAITGSESHDLGVFRLPESLGKAERIILLCRFDVTPGSCEPVVHKGGHGHHH